MLFRHTLAPWVALLRWNKPSGRLILLIPAGWSLWLTPNAPPSLGLVFMIVLGGLAVSGAGCIANDLWDRHLDRNVERTKQRPLAQGTLSVGQAIVLLFVMLIISLCVVLSLPDSVRNLCLLLACLALPPILVYPSAKRWFAYPQAVLALCWGFAVLIPWAAQTGALNGGLPLAGCWIATLLWTFSFDTVYAMADRPDDARMALNSSALTLGSSVLRVVGITYALSMLALAVAAAFAGIGVIFWPFWLVVAYGMQRATRALNCAKQQPMSAYGMHFSHQVRLGALLLFGLVLGRLG
ncbi:MAG: 4-hydroxybenzoate octaprenyltransferase [Propionibacteriaceae bacterium]|nr:4-hydroxybenzoate octaprenyltransferase [Propionibacteriaceae bacterium]MBT65820.1 4-hydroxybenzoate octaprenyltransferase [Synechococcus sp. NP17]|tara:strand:+ start:18603 stop:19490 length:888 start_codon:yes stop_codon:yes gene_type:complete